MADEEGMKESGEIGGATAVADSPAEIAGDAPRVEGKKPKGKKKDDDGDLEYEVEFATPFGKLEFEFEPQSKKEKKDRDRKAKAERDAAKKALQQAERAAASGGGGRGFLGTLIIVLAVLALIGGAIAAAYWLFARPGQEEIDAIPPEFANEPEPQPAAQGLVARARGRVRSAISQGRQASRDAQREQREKFDQMAGGR